MYRTLPQTIMTCEDNAGGICLGDCNLHMTQSGVSMSLSNQGQAIRQDDMPQWRSKTRKIIVVYVPYCTKTSNTARDE